MSAKYFVDSNILVYAHDLLSGTKNTRARQLIAELWSSGEGVLSTQVLQEVCVSLRRKAAQPLPFDQIRELLTDYLAWEVVVNDERSVLGAMEIEQRYSISFWDALIVHAAQAADAEIVYSEDLSHGQKYASVRVVNPFIGPTITG